MNKYEFSQDTIAAIEIVIARNPKINRENLEMLIAKTGELGGCTIISIAEYNSAKSDFSELANHQVNIGASYEPMIEKSTKKYAEVTSMDFARQLIKHNFGKYVVADLRSFKREVLAAFGEAITELLNPTKKAGVSNDLWLNKVLVFNMNTLNLGIMGQSLKKTVTAEGDFKPTKSAPKTVAKNIIKEICASPKDKLRRFNIGLLDAVKMQGETMEIA